MSNTDIAPQAREDGDTVWTERDALIDRIPRPIAIVGVFLVFLGAWYGTTAARIVSPIILPTPHETWKDILYVGRDILTGGPFFDALVTTSFTVVYAFALSILIGVVLGIAVGETKFGERALMPYLVGIDAMPKIAFAPLFVAWLGFGIGSKVALATFMATFPIVVATASGLHAASENERMLFRSIGATPRQILFKLKIPSGLPYLFTGLKIASVGVMAGTITGEFLGGGKGVGALIRQAASQMSTPRVFSLILFLSVIGLLVFGAVSFAQKRLLFWHRSNAGTKAGG